MGTGKGLFFLERLARFIAVMAMIAGAVMFSARALQWSGRFTLLSFEGAMVLCLAALCWV